MYVTVILSFFVLGYFSSDWSIFQWYSNFWGLFQCFVILRQKLYFLFIFPDNPDLQCLPIVVNKVATRNWVYPRHLQQLLLPMFKTIIIKNLIPPGKVSYAKLKAKSIWMNDEKSKPNIIIIIITLYRKNNLIRGPRAGFCTFQ